MEDSDARTLDDVYSLVSSGFDDIAIVNSDGFTVVGEKLDQVLEHIQSSQASDSANTTGTVALDQAQIEMLQNGITVVTTESFLLVVLLATLCGLASWLILSRGWFR